MPSVSSPLCNNNNNNNARSSLPSTNVSPEQLTIQRHHCDLCNCVSLAFLIASRRPRRAEKGRGGAGCRLIDLFSALLFSAHISPLALEGALTLWRRMCWHFLFGVSLSL